MGQAVTDWADAIGIDDEHWAFRETVRAFARRVVAPIADEMGRADQLPEGIIAAFVQAGLTQLIVPDEWGGSGGDITAICIAKEEIARAGSSALSMLCGQNVTLALPLLRFGTESQRCEILTNLGRGALVSMCLTEADVGSRPAEMRSQAHRTSDGWVLSGQKSLITWGELASYAVIFAQSGEPGGGISAFIVDTKWDGYTIVRHNHKLGQHGLPNVDILLDDLFVPETRLLGPPGGGLQTALGMLHVNRPTMGAIAIGTAQAALDYAIDFLENRQQRGRPMTDHQGLRWMIADMATELTASRALLYECARQIDGGQPLEKVAILASMAKLKATEVATSVTNGALQLLGGAGYLSDHPVERYFRDVRVGTLYEGTSEIQRNTIARGILSAQGNGKGAPASTDHARSHGGE
jgi:alkylation response protein AidB-like acyl-CoA dehydrogenase